MFGLRNDGPLGAGAAAGRPQGPHACSPEPIHCHLDPLFDQDRARPLSAPFIALAFPFADGPPELQGTATVAVTALADGCVHAVGIWFELQLDAAGRVTLITAPRLVGGGCEGEVGGEGGEGGDGPERDHWRQAVCFLPEPRHVHRGEVLHVRVWHDDLTPAFALISGAGDDVAPPRIPRGLGGANDHPSLSWSRLAQLDDRAHWCVHSAWRHELPLGCAAVVALGDSLTTVAAWATAEAAPAVSMICCCSALAARRARAWLECARAGARVDPLRVEAIRFVDSLAGVAASLQEAPAARALAAEVLTAKALAAGVLEAKAVEAKALAAKALEAQALVAEVLKAEVLEAEVLAAKELAAKVSEAGVLGAEAASASEVLEANAKAAKALEAKALTAGTLAAKALEAKALAAKALAAKALAAKALAAKALEAEVLAAEAADATAAGGSPLVAVVGEAYFDRVLGSGGASHMWPLDSILTMRHEVSSLATLLAPRPDSAPGAVGAAAMAGACGGQYASAGQRAPRLVVVGARAYRLLATPIDCAELWRRRQPIGHAEEVDLSTFNERAPRPSPLGPLAVLDVGPWRNALTELAPPTCVASFDIGACASARVALARAETLAATLRTTRDGTCHALLLWSEVDGGGEVERACDLSGRHGCLLVEAPRHAPAGTAVRVELRVAPPRAGEPRDAARGCRVEWEGGVVWEEAMEHDHDGDSLRLAASARGGAEGGAVGGAERGEQGDGEGDGHGEDPPATLTALGEDELCIGQLVFSDDDND